MDGGLRAILLWRRAKATGRHIVLEAPPDEIEMHKSDLDEDMAYTNAAYRKHLEAVQQQKAREEEAAQDDRSLLHDLRQKLFGQLSLITGGNPHIWMVITSSSSHS